MAVGSLGSILPELILLIGGLVILLLDTAFSSEEDSGRGFMAVAILFLVVALVGVVLQFGMEPHTALTVIDVDPFATFVKVIVYTAMIFVAIAGGTYMNRRTRGRGEFWTLFMFVTLAMSVAVSANNLLLIFLGIEFLSITSYILVGSIRQDLRSSEAGLKYFLYGSVASAVMLYGMSLVYGATGSLDLIQIGTVFAENAESIGVVALPAAILMLAGLGFKASLAPFFQWTPDTYEGAPTPVTAYLSTASKAVGFAVIARVMLLAFAPAYEVWIPVLGGLAVLTMFAGNLMAMRQSNVKRMLAYSSVAQAGYILLGLVSVVNPSTADATQLSMNGLNGLLIYLIGYLFTNIGAFMVVLAVENMTGGSDYSHFNGLVKRSPWLAVAMTIFLLSLVGIPLTAGFVGKFFVFGATVQHQYYFLAVMALINVAISAVYYIGLIQRMYFPKEAEPTAARGGAAGVGVQAIIAICVVGVFWIGIYPPMILEWANSASQFLLAVM
jgi:proton-translocating NADH-quinone oxidoreductase chain N